EAALQASSARDVPRTLVAPDGTGEGDDLDAGGAGGAERGRRGVDGGTARVHVVDEHEPALGAGCGEGAAHVPAPLGEAEPPLPPRTATAGEKRLAREPPRGCERAGKLLGRLVAALEPAGAVAGDEDER